MSRSTWRRCRGRSPDDWVARGRGVELVAGGDAADGAAVRPLRLEGIVAVPRPLLGRGGAGRRARCWRWAPGRPPASNSTCSRDGLARLFGDDRRRAPAPRRGVGGAAAVRGRRRRPGHGQDDHGRADRRAAVRAGARRRTRACRWSRSRRRPARRRRGCRRPCTREAAQARGRRADPRRAARAARRRRCTGCSAGGPAATAAFATTATSASPTTS